jgi:hypothetical protein
MDGLEDTVGGLSLSAKEWRPGQGLASASKPSRQNSAGEERLASQPSWPGELEHFILPMLLIQS